jgi:hypothetical protein
LLPRARSLDGRRPPSFSFLRRRCASSLRGHCYHSLSRSHRSLLLSLEVSLDACKVGGGDCDGDGLSKISKMKKLYVYSGTTTNLQSRRTQKVEKLRKMS